MYTHLYEAAADFAKRDTPPSKTYIIATIPRTGSTLLALEAWRSGALGAPMEYLNPEVLPHLKQRINKGETAGYWTALQSLRTSPNGVFGIKLFVQNYFETATKSPELLPFLSGRYVISLRRRDKVAQAVSYSRAIRGKSWFAVQPAQGEVGYDYDHIAYCERIIAEQEEKWDAIFRLTGEEPLELFYEDVQADPRGAVMQMCQFLGVEPAETSINVPMIQKQAGPDSHMWAELYSSEGQKRKLQQA